MLPRRTAFALCALSLAWLASPACDPGRASTGPADFDAGRAWKDLEAILALGPRPAASEALEKTRGLIWRELSAAGLAPVREEFTVEPPKGFAPAGPIRMANVYADLPAREADAEIVILCTHFDTKIAPFPFVGANDGGAGTAILLELARALAKGGPRALAYRILFLDGEESLRWTWEGDDNTYGSRRHAAALKESGLAARVRCAVLLDLAGDKDLRFLRESMSDRRLNELFIEAARGIGLGAHVDGPSQEARDDHISFMNIGIPSIDLIDFQYGPGNAWWHSREDTLDKCSRESLSATGRIVLAALPAIETRFARR